MTVLIVMKWGEVLFSSDDMIVSPREGNSRLKTVVVWSRFTTKNIDKDASLATSYSERSPCTTADKKKSIAPKKRGKSKLSPRSHETTRKQTTTWILTNEWSENRLTQNLKLGNLHIAKVIQILFCTPYFSGCGNAQPYRPKSSAATTYPAAHGETRKEISSSDLDHI